MSGETIDFATLIEQDRAERQKREWSGTFLQYLELVKTNPHLADLAHKRMYDMMVAPGVAPLDLEADPKAKRVFGDETVTIYGFFKDEFFGMERLKACVRVAAAGTAAEIAGSVREELDAFRGGAAVRDDVTLVVIKRPGGWSMG